MYVFYTVLCKHKNYKEKFVTPIMASQISFDFTINIPLSMNSSMSEWDKFFFANIRFVHSNSPKSPIPFSIFF